MFMFANNRPLTITGPLGQAPTRNGGYLRQAVPLYIQPP
jgi:hypothetical protein